HQSIYIIQRLVYSYLFTFYFLFFFYFFFFFFQAEDGIRDLTVTGVQTCALPIYLHGLAQLARLEVEVLRHGRADVQLHLAEHGRSEERRVGKECRSRWWTFD